MLLLPFAKQTVSVRNLQTNKAERVIKLSWRVASTNNLLLTKSELSLARFVNFYNTVKPHTGISNMTPYEKLRNFHFSL